MRIPLACIDSKPRTMQMDPISFRVDRGVEQIHLCTPGTNRFPFKLDIRIESGILSEEGLQWLYESMQLPERQHHGYRTNPNFPMAQGS